MNKPFVIPLALIILLLLGVPQAAAQAEDPPPNLEDIRFDQRLNQQIPLDLVFQDETGKEVRLGDYFGEKPVVLVFAYYDCPMLCGLVLDDLVDTVSKMNFNVNEEFEIVAVSIDPNETPELATSKKKQHLIEYGRMETGDGWHFLVGKQQSIDELTEAAGFRYFYVEESGEFAHPTGLIVLTPQGVISRYFFGLEFPANDLRLGLIEASDEKIGTPVDQFFLYCYHYDPETGRYSLYIYNILRLAGVVTVVVIAGSVLAMLASERRAGQSSEEEVFEDYE